MGVAVEAEGARGGQAELAEALSAVDVVGVGGDQQAARLQLDAVTRAQSKGGPVCRVIKFNQSVDQVYFSNNKLLFKVQSALRHENIKT